VRYKQQEGGIKGMQQHLVERAGIGEVKVDREASVIRGVRVMNATSIHKRDYSPRAMGDVAKLAEGAHVFDQHDNSAPGKRSVRSQLGILRNACVESSGVTADLHVSARESWLLEDAERIPESVALSINAFGKVRMVPGNGRLLVESVERLASVDLVPVGGTTKTLFEHAEEEQVDFTELTLAELRENRPDLVKEVEANATAVATADSTKDQAIAQLQQQLKESGEANAASRKKLDEYDVREAIAQRGVAVATALKESGLPETAVTDSFRKLLESMDKPEDVQSAIMDRKAFIESAGARTGGVRNVGMSNEAAPSLEQFTASLRE